jgi:uncharacterized RDD family membrane protein YckC
MTLAHERTSEFLEGTTRARREIVTPEGVAVPVDLAEHGARAVAFAIDLFIWLVALIGVVLLLVLITGVSTAAGKVAISIALFLAILVRNFYFIFFEMAWRGQTPGKRLTGLRVIDASGGPLQPSAVVARNLTRELEMFIPIGVLLTWGKGGATDWEQLFIAAWLLFFLALPLINRNRMRGGDMIAGTMVISLPKLALSGELAEQTAQFVFSEQQLQAYGAFELQVLEELLRHLERPDAARVLPEVCEKICRKIGWTTPVPANETLRFLREFYTAERAYLERAQLYGKARADKHDRPKTGG